MSLSIGIISFLSLGAGCLNWWQEGASGGARYHITNGCIRISFCLFSGGVSWNPISNF
jgi:hypothetical protein